MTDFNFTGTGLPNPSDFVPRFVTNAAIFRSPLTGSIQVAARAGEHWEYDVSWTNVSSAARRDLIAFFVRLNGPVNRVRFEGEWGIEAARGAYGGSPIVNLAGQTGNTLNIDGCTATITDWIKAGDWFRWNDDVLRMQVVDADSNGSGEVVLDFMPEIRTSPADAVAIVTGGPTGLYRMVTPVEFDARDILASGDIVSSLQLSFVDAMP